MYTSFLMLHSDDMISTQLVQTLNDIDNNLDGERNKAMLNCCGLTIWQIDKQFAGKYLNVVRECGRDVTCPDAKEVLYTLKERAYVEQIEKAYNYASKVLLDFLMEEKELVSRLRWGLMARIDHRRLEHHRQWK